MASIIRIKRSSTSGNPSTLGAGELAYSGLTDNGSNGGDRLYIGMGTETAGNAVNHVVIGGKFFTDMLDHTKGSLTANSALIVDADSKLNQLKVDNLDLNGNTISSTDTNGNIFLTPNGTGKSVLTNVYIGDTNTSLTEFIQDVTGGQISDSAEIDVTYDDATGTTTLDLKTTGVTAGSYGSTTAIPTFTVDSKGRLTAAGTVNVATTLSIAGDTGTDSINLLTDTLTVSGGEGIDVAVTNNEITVSAEDATTTNKGVASFATANFNVSSGAVSAKDITLGSSTLTLGSTTSSLAGLSSLGVTGNTTIGGTIGVTGAATLGSTLGVAGDFAVNTNKFTVAATSGNTAIAGTLGVTGNTTVGGTLGVTGAVTLSSTLAVTNDLTVNTNKFTVAASSGNTAVAGTLAVTAATTLSSTLGVTGNTTVGGTLAVTGATTLSSSLGVTGNTTVGGTLAVTGVATFGANVDMNAHKITNLAEPTADSDAATKYYVDAARSGLDVKQSVRAATTENITLSNTQTVDGVALAVGNRVLVKNQTTASQNGIYVVASGSWTRATDADNTPTGEVTSGMFCFVEEGTVNADCGFVLTTNDPISLGTTELDFALFSSSGTLIAGNGLSKNGYTLEVNLASTGGIEIVSDNLQLKSSVAGAGLTYSNGVVDVVGTSNRITVNSDSIDIASTYVGQTSITTLGTIGTGTWQGTIVDPTYGGTGVNNGTKTITLGGNFATSGAYAVTLTATGATNVTLPTTGTLATLAGAETLTNKTIQGAVITGGSINNTPIGGTTANTGAFTTLSASGTITASGNITGAGADTSTLDGFNIDGGTY